ncbi:MAG: lysozyme inhibitor LprI family protein [Alphaproteobacteria bacterium]
MKEAQAAWVMYRDSHCRSMSLPYSPGSITPAVQAACLARLTRQRVKELSDDFRDSLLVAPTGRTYAPGSKKN